jgi:type III secretory pathway component EscS
MRKSSSKSVSLAAIVKLLVVAATLMLATPVHAQIDWF